MKSLWIIPSLFIILFSGCSFEEPIKFETLEGISKAKVKKIDLKDVDGFYEDDLSFAFDVFKKDCNRSKRYKLFKNICMKAKDYLNGTKFFSENFTAYELYSNGTNNGLITGYYEPLLNGSRIKDDKYKYPIYKVPEDMYPIDLSAAYPELKKYNRLRGKLVNGKIIAYDDRAQINKRKDLEAIVYVDDEIDLFFLQIQGSGKVALDTGEIINVGYANQNGHKYFAIGRTLFKEGVLKKTGVSLQSIKKYLKQNPQRVDEILNKNKSYIFFVENKKSATGALGTELTAGRNLAVDKKYIPLGMPVFINTINSVSKEKINRLMVAADVGGAIKGEIRADFFFGNGSEAEIQAGKMKSPGKLTILVPNE